MKLKNNKKGFTLVELVIVIAVIAILAAVLIPTFATVIANANKSALQSEASNLYTGILVEYAEDGFEQYCKDFAGDEDSVTITLAKESTDTILKSGMKHYNEDTATFLTYVSEGTKVVINKTGTITVSNDKYTVDITKDGVGTVAKV